MKLHVFNPDTDLALACNGKHYLAPEQVRGMTRDLALLPLWYARAGEKVWIPDGKAMLYASQMCLLFNLQVEVVTGADVMRMEEVEMSPWGWNPAIRHFFLKNGVAAGRLPSADEIETYRTLASRQTSAALLGKLPADGAYCGEAEVLKTLDACRTYVEAHQGGVVFKAPWSSSGKGLCWCRNGFSAVEGWCGRVLKEQGALIASPIYNKVDDFAMEFVIDACGKVVFEGYSLFLTDGRGRYLGNRVLSSALFEEYMSGYVTVGVLDSLRTCVALLLEEYAEAGYRGPLGVDMMVCKEGDGFRLHPMVEVNLRMNMGIVALRLAERVLAPGLSGLFHIEHYPAPGALYEAYAERMRKSAPVIEGGRLVRGCLPLAPVTSESRCLALLEVD